MTTPAWWSLLTNPSVRTAFIVWFEGIPTMFSSQTLLDLDGAAVTTASLGGETYDLRTMLAEQDISTEGGRISIGKGIADSGSMKLTLSDDRSDYLLDLFKSEGGNVAVLTQDLAYNGTTFTVHDTSTFSAGSGYLWSGIECMGRTGLTPTTFTGGTRGLFGSLAVGYEVASSPSSQSLNVGVNLITDFPRVWKGRRAQVRMCFLTPQGRLWDGDPVSTDYSPIIFTGVINKIQPTDDYNGWTIDLDDILSLVRGKVNFEASEGELYIPDTPLVYIPANHRTVYFQVDGAEYSEAVVLTNDWVDLATLYQAIWDALDTLFTAALGADLTQVEAINTTVSSWGDPTSATPHFKITHANSHTFAYIEKQDSIRLPYPINPVTITTSTEARWYLKVFPQYYLWPDCKTLPVVLTADTTWASAGYIILAVGDHHEIIEYSSITASQWEDVWYLNIPDNGRARFGTEALCLVQLEDASNTGYLTGSPIANPDQPTIKSCLAIEGNLFRKLLNVLMSTGNGNNGSYDVLVAKLGQAIPEDFIDVGTFERAAMLGGGDRLYLFTEDLDIEELIDQELFYMGFCIAGAMTTTGYKITLLEPNSDPHEALSLSSGSSILWNGKPKYSGQGDIYNVVEVYSRWDYIEGEPLEPAICVKDQASIGSIRKEQALPLKTSGLGDIPIPEATNDAICRASEILNKTTRDRYRLNLGITRIGWRLKQGDTVSITCAAVPTLSGVRGLVATKMMVTNISYAWAKSGSTAAPCTIEVELRPMLRGGRWSPSALISGVAGTTLTLADNTFSEADEGYKDIDFFEATYAVRIINLTLNDSVDRTISSKGASSVVINSALPGGWTTATDVMYLVFDDYGDQVAGQKITVSLSDTAGQVASGVEGYKWV